MLAVLIPLLASLVPVQQPAPASRGPQWIDVDDDGRQDLLAVTATGGLQLLYDTGQGSFEDRTAAFGLGEARGVQVLVVQDVNADGRPDLLLGASGSCRLFANEGGLFTDVTSANGLTFEGDVVEARWLDSDGDGRLDLHLIATDGQQLFRGLAAGGFARIDLPLAASEPSASEGVVLRIDRGDDPLRESALDPAAGRTDRAERSVVTSRRPGSETGRRPAVQTSGGTVSATQAPAATNLLGCVQSLKDQAGGACLEASSVPTLGRLYPISPELYVDAATGNVGMGTTTPGYALEVDGQVVSGVANTAPGVESAIGGGRLNNTTGEVATVAGGDGNAATGLGAFVGGGAFNLSLSDRSAVAGGVGNRAAYRAFVGGGDNNAATGNVTAIAGGKLNEARQTGGFVGGGENNVSDATHAAIGGGFGNSANASDTAIAGGRSNLATGAYGSIPGGRSNVAAGAYSLAAGRRARALHDGAIVFADSADADFDSSGPDQFLVEASGGMGVGKAPDPSFQLDVDGAFRAADTIVSTKPAGAPFAVASSDVSANLNADLLDGFHASAFSMFGSVVDAGELANDSVDATKIVDGSIGAADLGAASVGMSALQTGAVSLSKIDPSAGASGQVLGHDGSSAIWTSVRDSSWTSITSLPFTIDTTGAYYLAGDLTGVSGSDGISVVADDVWIDLNGHTLVGVPGAGYAIGASGGTQRTTVVNGFLRGWPAGVRLRREGVIRRVQAETDGDGLAVDGGLIEHCTVAGSGSGIGVFVSDGGVVRSTYVQDKDIGIWVSNSSAGECMVRNSTSSGFLIFSGTVVDCSAFGGGRGVGFDLRSAAAARCFAAANDSGFTLQGGSRLQGSFARTNTTDYKLFGNDGAVVECSSDSTGGVTVSGDRNRVEACTVRTSLQVTGADNVVIRNSAGSYSIGAGNLDAQVIAPGSGFSSSNAWANLQY